MVRLRSLPLTSGAAMVLIVVYLAFTGISIAQYPKPWSPFTTYLSDFGNMKASPSGSAFYNLGCVATGLSLVPFYIGLKDWYGEDRWRYAIMAAQLLGGASGLALSLIGVYPEDFPADHRFWSYAFFTLSFFAMLLANSALLMREASSRRVAAFGYVSLGFTLFTFILFGGIPIVEWVTVATSLLYAGLLGLETLWLEQ